MAQGWHQSPKFWLRVVTRSSTTTRLTVKLMQNQRVLGSSLWSLSLSRSRHKVCFLQALHLHYLAFSIILLLVLKSPVLSREIPQGSQPAPSLMHQRYLTSDSQLVFDDMLRCARHTPMTDLYRSRPCPLSGRHCGRTANYGCRDFVWPRKCSLFVMSSSKIKD